MIRFLGLLIITGIISSCVSNKKITFLQVPTEFDEEFELDTVLRDYSQSYKLYKIQSEDILSVSIKSITDDEYNIFKENQNLNQQGNLNAAALNGYLVDDNGEIEFPVVGKVKVAGRTISEIEELIHINVNPYLTNPAVRVRLLNFRVTILGEVNSEGVVDIFNNQASIFEVIGRAGGLTDLAKRNEIKLIRKEGEHVGVSYINLLDENLIKSPYYYLQNNDILIVEPLKQRPFRKYFGPNLALIISSISVLLLTFNLIN
ncbi:MAG: polysaccharide biosynthesis/export family protein [Fulvivirga sp.]|uniref:polysaccharide biosynthesis/export family protein n=1 Tax=Fulvivirga sp. TaxID=1931237 RepID=UPI0032F06B5A